MQMLRLKGFPEKWITWTMQTLRGGKVGIKVNDRIGNYFPTYKGLRQGDALSSLIFDLVADALAIIMENARAMGLIKGVISNKLEGGVNMLQYADDTIFLLQDDVESAQNLKFVLTTFEQISGLKINFNKSEMFLFGGAKNKEHIYSEIFGCVLGELPMKYLGFPIDEKRIRNKGWQK